MRRLTSIAVRPLVATVFAVALIGGLAAGTARAASGTSAQQHPTAAAVTTVTWHRLALRNGWRSSRSKSYSVANPSYTVIGGIVYLDGSLHQSYRSATEFAVLPRGARPAHKVFLTVLSGSVGPGVPGTVEIEPNGVMRATSAAGTARKLTSLEAVSFPAAGAHRTSLKLLNGWQSGSKALGTGDPAYTVRSGIAYLSGSLSTTSGSSTQFAKLPRNVRPRSVLYLAVYANGGSAGDLVIEPSGVIYDTSYGQIALDGVSYPTAAAKLSWHKLKLSTGWTSSQSSYSTGDPEYAVAGPIVYLAGSMYFNTSPAGNSSIFAAIPKAAQPLNLIVRQVYTNQDSTGALVLATFGIAGSNPSSNAEEFTSLAGISYPRNS
jgi:hypothetical protein